MAKPKKDTSLKYGWGLGQRHPLRNQFSGFYKGRPELSGTPDYSGDWLKLRPQAKRFQGITPKKEREAQAAKEAKDKKGGGGSAAPIMFNMFSQSEDRSVTNTTNNNYMGGRGFVDDGEPDWGSPGGEFQDAASFEPMNHDLHNVRERGGGNWDEPVGELGTGQPGVGPGDSSGALGV